MYVEVIPNGCDVSFLFLKGFQVEDVSNCNRYYNISLFLDAFFYNRLFIVHFLELHGNQFSLLQRTNLREKLKLISVGKVILFIY